MSERSGQPAGRGWRAGLATALRRVAATIATESAAVRRGPAAAPARWRGGTTEGVGSLPQDEPRRSPALGLSANHVPMTLVDPLERTRLALQDARRQMPGLLHDEPPAPPPAASLLRDDDALTELRAVVAELQQERRLLAAEVTALRELVCGVRDDLALLTRARTALADAVSPALPLAAATAPGPPALTAPASARAEPDPANRLDARGEPLPLEATERAEAPAVLATPEARASAQASPLPVERDDREMANLSAPVWAATEWPLEESSQPAGLAPQPVETAAGVLPVSEPVEVLGLAYRTAATGEESARDTAVPEGDAVERATPAAAAGVIAAAVTPAAGPASAAEVDVGPPARAGSRSDFRLPPGGLTADPSDGAVTGRVGPLEAYQRAGGPPYQSAARESAHGGTTLPRGAEAGTTGESAGRAERDFGWSARVRPFSDPGAPFLHGSAGSAPPDEASAPERTDPNAKPLGPAAVVAVKAAVEHDLGRTQGAGPLELGPAGRLEPGAPELQTRETRAGPASSSLEMPAHADVWLTLAPVEEIGWLTALERRLRLLPVLERMTLKSYRRREAVYLATLRQATDLPALVAAVADQGHAVLEVTTAGGRDSVRVRLADGTGATRA